MFQRRRRFKQTTSLEDRLIEAARRLRNKAEQMQPGWEREQVLRQARRHETTAHLSEWLQSPGLQPPK